ncbi:hypothetical protein BB560_001847 [Smittium megazygosporum]|uniref:Uncharacterized protein n=1 Tax=Smittium megazygosporum TaxID=133381 RepID=A0A2T9ZGF6_9FUNG|nr:hypothetical protein BB560_001845 [Smittium megazygosporum]PVV03667.1 hypothetical protein BB560_001847 [Smittium megazygosporum]
MNVSRLFDVRHKTVLVTGGSRGIGLMIATGFVENGARVYISSRSADVCNRVAEELTGRGPGECISLPADLQNMSDIENLAEAISKREPDGLDVLINNAGATWGASIDEYPESAFNKVMNLNVINVFFLTQKLIPLLERKGTADCPSRIINIGSIAGIRVPISTFAYAASKSGLHHMSKAMAIALGPRHITVNSVAPGPFQSKMMRETLEKNGDEIVSANPMGRIGRPNDMAGACIYLASRAGNYVNGAVLVVDGGSSIVPRL